MDEKKGHEEQNEDIEIAQEVIIEEAEEIIDEEQEVQNSLEKMLLKSEEKLLRLMAEFDNYRKRTAKEKDGIYPQAQADTIARILPVLDNFERALDYECGSDEYAKGIEMIYKTFKDVFESLKVETVGQVGEAFDPQLHDAVMHIEDPKLGENVVAEVLQKGYRTGDRVIRHASVKIAN